MSSRVGEPVNAIWPGLHVHVRNGSRVWTVYECLTNLATGQSRINLVDRENELTIADEGMTTATSQLTYADDEPWVP